MENFGKFMTVILLMIISPIISGFVIMKLWMWFIVPTFEVNPIRIVEAIGFMFLINFIRSKRDKDAKGKFWDEWIVQMFM
jgi:hypothetical protein